MRRLGISTSTCLLLFFTIASLCERYEIFSEKDRLIFLLAYIYIAPEYRQRAYVSELLYRVVTNSKYSYTRGE